MFEEWWHYLVLVIGIIVLWVVLAYVGVIKWIRKQLTSKKPAEKEETEPIVQPEPDITSSSNPRVRYLAV